MSRSSPEGAPTSPHATPRARPLLTVTAAQFRARPDRPDANLRLGVRIVREAAAQGADLVLFPEMWSTGYALPVNASRALDVAGEWVDTFRDLARELGVGIAPTLLARGADGPRNTCLVIDRSGEVILRHDKVHLPYDSESTLVAGDTFDTAVFDGVRIGVMTCFDREFPESARELMLGGAELVLVTNASAWNPVRAHQLETRAFENMMVVCMANYPGDGWGQSSAYSPIVFGPDGSYRDPLIARADAHEQLVSFRIDLGALREWRAHEVWGDRYRRPDAYRRLALGAVTAAGPRTPQAGNGSVAATSQPGVAGGPVQEPGRNR